MSGLTLFAPAKINLQFHVGDLRDDGFHEVSGLLARIPLYDIITLTPATQTDVIMQGMDLPVQENLAYRAAKLFFERSGLQGRVLIRIFKGIPAGAGLGGGSSDAAAVLKGLNFMHDQVFSLGELMEMAAELGSDCPFFIQNGPALVSGRGERVQPVGSLPRLYLVVAIPMPGNTFGLGPLSTPRVYSALDRIRGTKRLNAQKGLTNMDKGVSITRPCARCFNELGDAITLLMPGAVDFRALMLRLGAMEAWFTGASATVVGRFENMEQAERASTRLVPLMGKGIWALPVEVKGWKE